MNKQRRKRIEKVCDELQRLLEEIAEIKGDELERYCNMPESLRESIRGVVMYDTAEAMSNAENSIVHAIGCLTEIYE